MSVHPRKTSCGLATKFDFGPRTDGNTRRGSVLAKRPTHLRLGSLPTRAAASGLIRKAGIDRSAMLRTSGLEAIPASGRARGRSGRVHPSCASAACIR